jgi:hypothetical protein
VDVTVTVAVYPEQGEFPRIAKALLEAADHPRQVLTVSNPRMGFLVPEDVFNRFHNAQAAAWEREDVQPVQEEAPAPKRRGRPRKQAAPPAEPTDAVTAEPVTPSEHDSEEDNA